MKSINFKISVICWFFYLGIVSVHFKQFNLNPHLNYFRLLADSFLNLKFDVSPNGSGLDLVFFNNLYYLYWPPVPALVFMPLVAIFGINLPDALINSLFGALNVYLFMKVCSKLSSKFELNLTKANLIWLGLFWGLGTVHFYMSMQGGVWFIAQIMAQTFLLSAVYFLLIGTRFHFLLSAICFACLCYTRNHIVFSLIFFVALIFQLNSEHKLKQKLAAILLFILPFIIFSLLNAYYNYARFGDIFDNGMNYHLMNQRFVEDFKKYGSFSLHYFAHNFYYEIMRPPTLMFEAPFIKREDEGFGFFWGSPVFFLLFPSLYFWFKNLIKPDQQNKTILILSSASVISAILISSVILLLMGTGWGQFCSRYSLDYQFFMIVFLLFNWKNSSSIPYIRQITALLLILSFVIQYIGSIIWTGDYVL